MRLTRAASYALYAMVHIAGHKPNDAPLASHEIAQAHNIPERFLLKVLKPLVSAGLLLSVKGPRGGYRLAKPATQITMLEVVEAVEGPIRGHASFHSKAASNGLERKLDSVCHKAAEETRRQLNSVRISQLADL
jgi:Rrf2 family protein